MNNCRKNCKVCNHPEIDRINLSIRAGIEHENIVRQNPGFSLRTLERHIRNQAGQLNYTQVGTALKNALSDLPSTPLYKLNSSEARLALCFRLLASVERLQQIAIDTKGLKAEQILGEVIIKGANLLSTLDYDAQPD